MSVKQFMRVAALCAAAGTVTTAQAQWLPDYQYYTIHRIGLYGAAQTGSAGLQSSTPLLFNAPGFVAGYSQRITGVDTDNGIDAWAWNGATTTQIGLTGAGYTGSAGYQYSEPQLLNNAGQVAGISQRIAGVDTYNGVDAWAWNGTTTTQIGLTGAGYTGSEGFQLSYVRFQNNAGQVTGNSLRMTGVNTSNGMDAWAWNGVTTRQIGFTGAGYTGSEGYQVSYARFQNDAGQVVGTSDRITGVSTSNGIDAWAWNGATTTQIGFTGAGYTGSEGYQVSYARFQNAAGQVVGTSDRITGVNTSNGIDAWAWNGATTTQIGFTGAGYTGSEGYQVSYARFQNAAGQVVGTSDRIIGVNTYNGIDAWVYSGATTTQIGFTGVGYTGSEGYQVSYARFQNAAGKVVGTSDRITGVNTYNGIDAWAWNGATTTQIGFTGAGYTGSEGFQVSYARFQNSAGQVAGTSDRITGVNTSNGIDAWAWNGGTTTQIGLTGAGYTGSEGFRVSYARFLNAAGQVAGTSDRITGVNTYNGENAWYFDPTTLLTSAVIGSVRTSDNFSYSLPTILTDGGFLLGNYTFFAGGLGAGEQRAFIFRPDLGLTDLGNLVNGGLTLNGWSTLQNPLFSDALNTIVGYGYVNGQTEGQSVFVMNIPAPGSAALLGLGGLIATRRRRC